MANPNAQGGPGHTQGVSFTTTNSPDRQRWKWELAIRFQLKNPNAKQSEVAQHIGVSPVTLSQWQGTMEWQDLHNQITTGILCTIDAELAEDITHQRLTLKRLVPTALQNLADLAIQTANPSIRLKATQEILDRDGHFSKVQRIGLPSEAQGGVSDEKDENVARSLIEALLVAKNRNEVTGPSIEAPPTMERVQ